MHTRTKARLCWAAKGFNNFLRINLHKHGLPQLAPDSNRDNPRAKQALEGALNLQPSAQQSNLEIQKHSYGPQISDSVCPQKTTSLLFIFTPILIATSLTKQCSLDSELGK